MDLRLVPAAVAAWVMAWLITGGLVPAWLLVTLSALVIVWQRRRKLIVATCIIAAGTAVIAAGWFQTIAESNPAKWCADGAHLSATAQIRSEPKELKSHFSTQYRVNVTLRSAAARGTSWQGKLPANITVIDPEVIPATGSVAHISGVCSTPWGDEKSVGTIRADHVQLESEPKGIDRLANRLRAGLITAMAASPQQQAVLVPSLVVGDTSGLDDNTENQFRRTGLTHILAVSGSNFSLALAFTGWIARYLGVRGWWLRAIAVVVSVIFVVTCRSEPSVLRATAMGLIALGATGLGPSAHRSARNLSVAVVVLLGIDPWLARSWGFVLSTAATAGIIWWAPRWNTSATEWIPGWIRQSVFISLAAQLATQPLVTAISDQVSLVAPISNLIVGPFLGPVTVLGLLAAMASLVFPIVALFLGAVAGWCVQPVITISQLLSRVPGATFDWPANALLLVLLAVICLLLGQWAVPALARRRWTALVITISLLIAICAPPRQFGWPGDWAVAACDVGQGGAVVISTGDSSAILVDAGPDPELIRRCLQSLRVNRITLFVLTHPHADHIGGITGIAGIPIAMALAGDEKSAESIRTQLGIAPAVASQGQVITVGNTQWETIATGPLGNFDSEKSGDSPDENNAGVVGIVTSQGLRTLVTGDLEEAGQQRVLQRNIDISCDVLVVPHHGSARQDQNFITAVRARISLIQVGEDNSYGHPARKALDLLEATGSSVWRTDRDGAIAVSKKGDEVITQK